MYRHPHHRDRQSAHVQTEPSGLQYQTAFLYNRLDGGVGGGTYVVDPEMILAIQDSIAVGLRHLYSPRSMRILNEALSTKVNEMGEWINEGPRIQLGTSTDYVPNQRIHRELLARSRCDGLQLVVDRSLSSRARDGEVWFERPNEIRINADRFEELVSFRQRGWKSAAQAMVVYIGFVIAHECVHAFRKIIPGCEDDTPPQLRSRSVHTPGRTFKKTWERADGLKESHMVVTGEGGHSWEEVYLGGSMRRVMVTSKDRKKIYEHQLEAVCLVEVAGEFNLETYFEVTPEQIDALERGWAIDFSILPIKRGTSAREWGEFAFCMAKTTTTDSTPQARPQPLPIDPSRVAPGACGQDGLRPFESWTTGFTSQRRRMLDSDLF